MTPTARRILELLASKAISTSAPNRAFSHQLSCSDRTFTRHLATLVDAGHVTIERRPPNLDGPGSDPTGRTIRITNTGLEALNTSPQQTATNVEK